MPSLLSHLTEAEQQELLADLNYLNTAEIQSFCKKHKIPYVIATETDLPAKVIYLDVPTKFTAGSKLFSGQYDKTNHKMIALLKKLTGGEFADGAIAKILLRDFWAGGVAPTFKQFAAEWQKAREEHNRPNPEWAFLSDLVSASNVSNWKQRRTPKAKKVLAILGRIPSTSSRF